MPIIEKFYPNGKPRMRQEMLDNDPFSGSLTKWHDNGQLRRVAVFTSRGDNCIKEYSDLGILESEEVVQGFAGERIVYYPNGVVKSRVGLSHGKIHGRAIILSEKGEVTSERYFINDVEVAKSKWEEMNNATT